MRTTALQKFSEACTITLRIGACFFINLIDTICSIKRNIEILILIMNKVRN